MGNGAGLAEAAARPLRHRPRGAVVLAMLAASVSTGYAGHLAREKFAVAGFASFSTSRRPCSARLRPSTRTSGTTAAWLAGAVAVALASAVMFAALGKAAQRRTHVVPRRILRSDAPAHIRAYRRQAVPCIFRQRRCRSSSASLSASSIHASAGSPCLSPPSVLVASAIQITLKIRDWRWAGAMTAEGARIVDAALAPACGSGHVVFLTGPVGIHSVYSHFYYETFEVPRGCMPEVFQVVARVMRAETRVAARWDGPSRIVITVPDYQGNIALSRDLRAFDVRFEKGENLRLKTPLGEVDAASAGSLAELTLTLAPAVQREQIQFFFYNNGRIEHLGRPE